MSHFVSTQIVTYDIMILRQGNRLERSDKVVEAREIGRRLIAIRGDIPRDELANAIGVSISAVSMYENGERIPRDDIKIRIANFFGRSVQEIFFDKECHV